MNTDVTNWDSYSIFCLFWQMNQKEKTENSRFRTGNLIEEKNNSEDYDSVIWHYIVIS